MGIPKFYGWYARQEIFRSTITNRAPSSVNIFAIDVNGLIHNNAQKVFGYGEFSQPPEQTGVVRERGLLMFSQQDLYAKRYEIFRGVFQDIVGLTQAVRPQRSLILAVDGVAPQAKINQQRNRRYKSAAERKPEQVFDSNVITPGTNFMFELDNYIQGELRRIVNVDQARPRIRDPYAEALPPHIIYSSHLVPGEGEHKIADHLRTMTAKGQTAVIYGADADLIMIYLMHLRNGWENIYLFRENKRNYSVQAMIDLRDLERIIQQLYPGAPAPVDDFVTLLFLNGNDFLPHFPTFERVPDALMTLIGGYTTFLQQNAGAGITTGSRIDWKNFGLFLQFIANNYGDTLLKAWGLNEDAVIKFPSLVAEKCIVQTQQVIGVESRCHREFDVSKFSEEWYKFVFSPKTGQGYIIPTEEDKREMIHSYLEGLAWVYGYYRNGVSGVNVSWYYPYHYSPIFADVPRFMLEQINEGRITWETNPIHLYANFVSPLEQIAMVLPPKSLASVPPLIQTLYSESSPIYDILPEGFLVDPQGKMEEWQSHAILPIPSPVRVERALIMLNLPSSQTQIYAPREDIILNRNIERSFRAVERGRGGFQPRGRGVPPRGRGFQPRGRGYQPRGRGGYQPRGRGEYQPRGGRGPSREGQRGGATFSRSSTDFRRTFM